MNIPKDEIGAAICRCGEGYQLGPVSRGTRNHVRVALRCRPGCRPAGVFHTHPGGPLELSPADIGSLKKAKLPLGCLTDGERMRCWKIRS